MSKSPNSQARSRSGNRFPVTAQNTIDVAALNLKEGDSTTTVAIGKDTYTIGKKCR